MNSMKARAKVQTNRTAVELKSIPTRKGERKRERERERRDRKIKVGHVQESLLNEYL